MQSVESLNMSLTALKSLLSDYAMRSTQAETMAGRLMVDKLSPEQFLQVLDLVQEQMETRSKERAVHQQALIQATIISLEASLRNDEQVLRQTVNETVKQLTLAQSYMNGSPRQTQTVPVNNDSQTDKE